jgi:hypothetical protein
MAATNLKVQHIIVSTKVYISVPVVLIINKHIVTRLVASRLKTATGTRYPLGNGDGMIPLPAGI